MPVATQYVDDNPDTEPMNAALGAQWNHQRRLLSYHFTMVPSEIDTQTGLVKGAPWSYGEPTSSAAYANLADNTQLCRLKNAADVGANASNVLDARMTQLQLMGEYMHAFMDTFAHRKEDNTPYPLSWGLGHALSGSDPDFTYDDPLDADGNQIAGNWYVREARTLQMETEVFAKLKELAVDKSKAKSFSEIVDTLRAFNETRESEGDGYDPQNPLNSAKIQVLQDKLDQWNIPVNIRDSDKPKYMPYEKKVGEENRIAYLCDKDGANLNQKIYAGTILPTCK